MEARPGEGPVLACQQRFIVQRVSNIWRGRSAIREKDITLDTWKERAQPCDELGSIGLEEENAAACMSDRSEEHTSELQSRMRISYAVFCMKQKKTCTPVYYNTPRA